eukprot:g17219.t1
MWFELEQCSADEQVDDMNVTASAVTSAVPAPAQPAPEAASEQGLPKWVKTGKRVQWFSASLKRLVPVRITKVDHDRSVVIATFEADSNVWKSVHFGILGREDCPLRGPAPGEQDWIGCPGFEQRRKAAQEIERQKVQAAFEQRKKEAEEQRLREEEEWRARLVERRKKEAAEEEERLRQEEEDLPSGKGNEKRRRIANVLIANDMTRNEERRIPEEEKLKRTGSESSRPAWMPSSRRHDHPRAACSAALAQQQALVKLNDAYASLGLPSIAIRIGLHTGDVLAVQMYEQALHAFHQRDFVTAVRLLQGLLAQERCLAAAQLLERALEAQRGPLPPTWTPVMEMTEK